MRVAQCVLQLPPYSLSTEKQNKIEKHKQTVKMNKEKGDQISNI